MLPGFVHDICAAIHPLAAASPFFRSLPLTQHGLEWIQPPAAVAHPFDDGTAAVLEQSFERTCSTLGADAPAYRRFFERLTQNADKLFPEILAPPLHVPRHPLLLSRFALNALRSAQGLARHLFSQTQARGLFAVLAAHSNMPLDKTPTAAFALVLTVLNYIGGDISGGLQTIWQIVARPALRLVPYSTPVKGLYICSSSSPPGGGVHGMCGYHAARAALAGLRV